MSKLNSYAEFVLGTYDALLVDCASHYPELTKEFRRDYKRLRSAIEQHGVRFALDTLPSFRKHFDKCLSEQRLTPSNLLHFGVDEKGGTIPRLFRGLVLRVFDRSGTLKHQPDVNAIRLLRQLFGVVRKLRLESPVRNRCEAVEDFFRLDLEVKDGCLSWADHSSFDPELAARSSFTDDQSGRGFRVDTQLDLFDAEPPGATVPYGLLEKVQQVADLISAVMGDFLPEQWRFRHGPGAVSDQRFGSYKYEFKAWPERLESMFPYADFALANYAQDAETHTGTSSFRWDRYDPPAKLHAVPKTLLVPRIIASEPTSLQWCQQAIRDYFYQRVGRTLISSFVDFRQQEPNGEMALSASHSKAHATIDLSYASDFVSCWHVERLFRRLPNLLRSLQASRSVWIEQSQSRVLPRFARIRKYSTMGNATTFPVQSLLFLSFALGCVLYSRNLHVNFKNIRALGDREVRVFGDDIVVPDDCSGLMVELLSALGFRVNRNKTFLIGNFRESCGIDAFDGEDVTTVNITDVPRRASPGSIVSCVDVHHNLCDAGFMATAAYIQKTAGRTVQELIPYVKHRSGRFGWSDMFGRRDLPFKRRFSSSLHVREIRALCLATKESRKLPESGSGLLQFFTEAPRVVTRNESSLGHLVRRPQVKLSLRWTEAE